MGEQGTQGRATVLVVDDDRVLRRQLYWALEGEHEVVEAEARADAVERLRGGEIDVVISDLHLPPALDDISEGLAVIEAARAQRPAVPVVVITGSGSRADALEAVRRGAYGFFEKPFAEEEVAHIVRQAARVRRLERENVRLRDQFVGRTGLGRLIGSSAALERVAKQARAVADTSATVLLAGDNGTGKSTLVEAIAGAIGFAEEGGELQRSGELPAVPRAVLDGALEPVLSNRKPSLGYFLRAESFFNVAAFVDSGGTFSPDLSLYGDVPLHQQSHGQSFLALASNRFGGEGLYVLDEPEAALSPSRQLALLKAIDVLVRQRRSQFVIATHSPILMAYPHATIYHLSERGIVPVAYEDTEHYRVTRDFLTNRALYLHHLLDDGQERLDQ